MKESVEKKSGVRVYRCPICKNVWQFCLGNFKWEILEGWGNIPLQYERTCPDCNMRLKRDMLRRAKRKEINMRSLMRRKRMEKIQIK